MAQHSSSEERFKKLHNEMVKKAWSDKQFKKKLLENPRQIAKEFGLEIPSDMDVEVVENTNKKLYFVLPHSPENPISEIELERIAGGDEYCK